MTTANRGLPGFYKVAYPGIDPGKPSNYHQRGRQETLKFPGTSSINGHLNFTLPEKRGRNNVILIGLPISNNL